MSNTCFNESQDYIYDVMEKRSLHHRNMHTVIIIIIHVGMWQAIIVIYM